MPFQKGHKGFRKLSTTPALIDLELKQLAQLAHVAQDKRRDLADRYQALAMIQERLEAVDRRFCECYYDQIPEGLTERSYEELTGTFTKPQVKKMAAGS